MESKYIDLVINRLTQAQYDELKRNNQISEEELYEIIDHDDLFYYKTELYTREELDTKFLDITTDISELDSSFSEFRETANNTYATKTELSENIIANPEIVGSEEVLESVKIDGVDYKVFPEGSIEFNTESSDDPTAYTLKSITVGTDIWNLPSGGEGGSGGGSNVIANPELDGGEEVLESIQIEDTKYTLQGQDMIFSESISEDPEAKILKTITIGTDDWKVDKGSVVTPNVELTGDEPVLESVQIDDATFTLKGEEMIFSETAVEGATVLRNIKLGDDNWAIPNGGSGGADLTGYATESYVDTKISELVNSAPETLNTLGELATALQENQGVVETLDSAITNKLDKSSIVYSETEPENPTLGMIWLKPAQ